MQCSGGIFVHVDVIVIEWCMMHNECDVLEFCHPQTYAIKPLFHTHRAQFVVYLGFSEGDK